MANPPSLFFFTSLLLCLSLSLASFPSPHCHNDEASALLRFKQSLAIDMCTTPFDYPKLESWQMPGQRSDCCAWEGVECDDTTGHVISLDLSGSCLYGDLSFNTTLSKLSRLGHINLACNNFRHSSIPSMSGLFPQLTYLNLSSSVLSGSVPQTISHLSKLSVLDLDYNDGLILEGHTFEAIVENITRLEYLHLSFVNISSTIPKMISNLSSLTSLSLPNCRLRGPFPEVVFNLNNLEYIHLGENIDLVGSLPQFNSSSQLQYLILYRTQFGGLLPESIGNLQSFKMLHISSCGFSGQLPISFENLTQLERLYLSYNYFEETNPSALSCICKQTKLTALGLDYISLPGDIPSYLASLTQLSVISLQSCRLTGPIPSWLSKMSKLQYLKLGSNKLQGAIPDFFSQLTQLSYLDLAHNNFSGKVDFNMFLGMEMLRSLFLSGNNLSLVHVGDRNATAGRFYQVRLESCNLQQFPIFLHDQNNLAFMDLSKNNIHGQVPLWLLNGTRDSLEYVDLSNNFITGFESDPGVFPWPGAMWIILNNNMFHGPLPLPPIRTIYYMVAWNNFTGGISQKFCTLRSLSILELSRNRLDGEFPQCLASSATSLEILALGENNLHGVIPQPSPKECNLRAITLEENNFEGKIPRSLANCRSLQFMNLANNKIQDTFPSWLGPLKQLSVLILRSNNLYGHLKGDELGNEFSKLGIIDISWNNLYGPLPTRYFIGWNAMKIKTTSATYLKSDGRSVGGSLGNVWSSYMLSMMLTNKGLETKYKRILDSLVAIDFSGNRFEGDIPPSIGNLSGLHQLNFSNNLFTGRMPSSLTNLLDLEALDLSSNNLSGEVPPELPRLTFLSFLNLSNNNLTGFIPKGNQFENFQNDSYIGNPGLCGKPLSKQCGNSPPPSPSSSQDDDDPDDDGSLFGFGWKPVAIGYASGFPLGIGLGYLVYTRKYIWIVKIFGEKRRFRRNVVRGVGQWDETPRGR